MAKTIIERQRITGPFETPVTDTVFLRCFWSLAGDPLLEPTAFFPEGSSGLEVEGPPTPRNVIFPEDTHFRNDTRNDCFFIRHEENIAPGDSKPATEAFVAELDMDTAEQLKAGEVTVDDLKTELDFVHISESPGEAEATYRIDGDGDLQLGEVRR